MKVKLTTGAVARVSKADHDFVIKHGPWEERKDGYAWSKPHGLRMSSLILAGANIRHANGDLLDNRRKNLKERRRG